MSLFNGPKLQATLISPHGSKMAGHSGWGHSTSRGACSIPGGRCTPWCTWVGCLILKPKIVTRRPAAPNIKNLHQAAIELSLGD